jgi:tetratricopeptide (TPR) repeat protein
MTFRPATSLPPFPVGNSRFTPLFIPVLVLLPAIAAWCANTSRVPASSPAPNAQASSQPARQPASRPAQPSATAPDQVLPEGLNPAFALIRERKTGPARVRLRQYLTLHPDDGKAHFLFGLSYHREKKYGEARTWFDKAIALEPEYNSTHYFLGWTLYYLGETDAAKASFERFLARQPGEYDSTFALGLIALDNDDLAEAERLFKQAIALQQASKPDDLAAMSRARARLGEVYERQDRLGEARTELEASVRLYPDHYEALYKLYRVLVRLDETEQAQKVHEQYIATRDRLRGGPTATSFPE